ncbi:glycosyltransferase family protein [Mucilaginibacter gilvus]|uniref:Glycosyltransferase n=1 Tax=Mucilaginibacter gilvus TaxID=2305909 RepID=A0A444MUR3_9SPHI|nr:hypothetical protein [Mucilaginibacter gilvus]RWY57327.1 hypothetical protein EPL05_01985 [Mucilaginibacter gilvus]
MSDIFKHSHFEADAFGHGGNKRTAQIDEILKDAGLTYKEPDFSNSAVITNKLPVYLKGLQYTKHLPTANKNKYAIGRYLKMFEAFVKKQKPGLVIWESTVGYNLLLAEILYKHHVPVVALPHNIESLVAGSKSVFSSKESPNWLMEELKYLGYCKKTFTISREENWLLSNTGINSDYLPYYPAKKTEEYLLAIRAQKQTSYTAPQTAKEILLLGTYYNKPTLDGYVELLNYIRQKTSLVINVVGFGSEQLNNMFPDKNIRIWGSVNEEKLASLVAICDYGVVHQAPSSGALTRIPEMLLAGLPLLTNTHAARSYFGTAGLGVYQSFEELLDMLHTQRPEIAPVPVRPVEEKHFADYIRTLLH